MFLQFVKLIFHFFQYFVVTPFIMKKNYRSIVSFSGIIAVFFRGTPCLFVKYQTEIIAVRETA